MRSTEAAWFRPLWLGVLIAASAALTTVFTCITPFAAFAVITATGFSRRNALFVTTGVWLANQVVGFGVLHYPWDAKTFAWGAAIGAAALIGTIVAQWTVARLGSVHSSVQALGAFIPAFAAYQVALYAVAFLILGGTGAFSRQIIGQVLLVNGITLFGLYGLGQLVAIAGVLSRRRVDASPARLA
jgi:hypothetical protein